MTAIVNDRSGETSGRFASSRKKFLKRNNVREAVKRAVEKSVGGASIKDIGKKKVDVTMPRKGIHEPHITHSPGGRTRDVRPGNKQFQTGDRQRIPPGGGGGGGGGGQPGQGKPGKPGDDGQGGSQPGEGDGEDDYSFELSSEEMLEILYEDLQLPNLTKESENGATQTQIERYGFKRQGAASHTDGRRSQREQMGRNMVFDMASARMVVKELIAQRDILLAYDPDITDADIRKKNLAIKQFKPQKKVELLEEEVTGLREKYDPVITDEDREKLELHDSKIEEIRKRRSMIPAWTQSDLRYRNYEEEPIPNCKAVMFCQMDVSYSMDQEMKNNAKLFNWVLFNFLKKNYDEVDIVFIRHTDNADEVDEDTFFNDRKSGGTKVSSSLEVMQEIIKDRYPTEEWNIYATQATDGDNPQPDNDVCASILEELLPNMQGYFYTEIRDNDDGSSWSRDFWDSYMDLAERYPEKFCMGKIKERSDILPVFHKFFEKREGMENTRSPIIAALSP